MAGIELLNDLFALAVPVHRERRMHGWSVPVADDCGDSTWSGAWRVLAALAAPATVLRPLWLCSAATPRPGTPIHLLMNADMTFAGCLTPTARFTVRLGASSRVPWPILRPLRPLRRSRRPVRPPPRASRRRPVATTNWAFLSLHHPLMVRSSRVGSMTS